MPANAKRWDLSEVVDMFGSMAIQSVEVVVGEALFDKWFWLIHASDNHVPKDAMWLWSTWDQFYKILIVWSNKLT